MHGDSQADQVGSMRQPVLPKQWGTLEVMIEIDQYKPRSLSRGVVVPMYMFTQAGFAILAVDSTGYPTGKGDQAAGNCLVHNPFHCRGDKYRSLFGHYLEPLEECELFGFLRLSKGKDRVGKGKAPGQKIGNLLKIAGRLDHGPFLVGNEQEYFIEANP